MLFRFSLYGFLKNLRVFDAFLLLALRERGLDYLAIGALVSVREVCVIVLEVPSGALADTLGRRLCMVASMLGYVAFSLLFWWAGTFWPLALGMLCFGVGDAFRSGTHKAMILAWLRQQDRLAEKTRVYGFTRSWSQLGSACSALCGGLLLVLGTDYRMMFAAYAGISLINLINLATYPPALDERDGSTTEGGVLGATARRMLHTARRVAKDPELRPILLTGVAVRGGYKVLKDYLQPVLVSIAVAMPILTDWSDDQRTGMLVGVVAAALFALSSVASRRAHNYEQLYGAAEPAARALALQLAIAFTMVGACTWFGLAWLAVTGFVLLAIGNNLWRPMQVGRLGAVGDGSDDATVLSIESQLGALFAAALAPTIGALVDVLADDATPTPLWAMTPLALLALPLFAVRFANRAEDTAR